MALAYLAMFVYLSRSVPVKKATRNPVLFAIPNEGERFYHEKTESAVGDDVSTLDRNRLCIDSRSVHNQRAPAGDGKVSIEKCKLNHNGFSNTISMGQCDSVRVELVSLPQRQLRDERRDEDEDPQPEKKRKKKD